MGPQIRGCRATDRELRGNRLEFAGLHIGGCGVGPELQIGCCGATDVQYSPGSVPRVNYRAQFMNKMLYFHTKISVFHLA